MFRDPQCVRALSLPPFPYPHSVASASPSEFKAIANELQFKYWDSLSGSYTGGELWTDAVRTMLSIPSQCLNISSTEHPRGFTQPHARDEL